MCSTTQRQRRKADAILNSSAQLIRRRDIARYSGSTTARLCVNFSAILWQLAMQSCDAAQ